MAGSEPVLGLLALPVWREIEAGVLCLSHRELPVMSCACPFVFGFSLELSLSDFLILVFICISKNVHVTRMDSKLGVHLP